MRAVVALSFASMLVASGVASCSNGVQADTGSDAYMQVVGAQFVRGPMPAGSKSGPAVEQITLLNANIWPGLTDFGVGGAIDPAGTAAAIGLQGDRGYWIVLAGTPNVAAPTFPTFGATAEFSTGIVPGKYTLVVRAVDENGNYGLPKSQILVGQSSPTTPPLVGDLVVTLKWDNDANLDLHVVQPDGFEVYWNAESSQTEMDGGSYGYIDYNSNANCVIDGLNREDAIWPQEPPPGHYTVRVDAANLCGEPIANWNVQAIYHGKQIAQASGVATDASTRGSHGVGSGVLAFQFTVP
jgi:hypothetical protein